METQTLELHLNEILLINVLRAFDAFLSGIGYRITGYTYNDRDGDVVVYEAPSKNRWVHIAFVVDFDILVIRQKRRWFLKRQEAVSMKDVKSQFPDFANLPTTLDDSNSNSIFEGYRRLMSERLLPILKGEIWFQGV